MSEDFARSQFEADFRDNIRCLMRASNKLCATAGKTTDMSFIGEFAPKSSRMSILAPLVQKVTDATTRCTDMLESVMAELKLEAFDEINSRIESCPDVSERIKLSKIRENLLSNFEQSADIALQEASRAFKEVKTLWSPYISYQNQIMSGCVVPVAFSGNVSTGNIMEDGDLRRAGEMATMKLQEVNAVDWLRSRAILEDLLMSKEKSFFPGGRIDAHEWLSNNTSSDFPGDADLTTSRLPRNLHHVPAHTGYLPKTEISADPAH